MSFLQWINPWSRTRRLRRRMVFPVALALAFADCLAQAAGIRAILLGDERNLSRLRKLIYEGKVSGKPRADAVSELERLEKQIKATREQYAGVDILSETSVIQLALRLLPYAVLPPVKKNPQPKE